MATIYEPTDGSSTITGTSGDDTIILTHGDFSIDGGDGVDTVNFSNTIPHDLRSGAYGSVVADLTTGTAVATGTNIQFVPPYSQDFTYQYTLTNVESLIGSAGGDVLKAGAAGATLAGLGGGDTLVGGAGNDLIIGGAGADILTGGGGADIFRFSAVIVEGFGGVVDSYAAAIDSIKDFQTGIDKLDLGGVQNLGAVSIVRTGSGSAVFGEIKGQPAEIQVLIGVTGLIQAGDVAGVASVQMVGDERDDLLIGGDWADSLYGHDGADVLIGGGAGDALYGGTGADTFRYLNASDSTNGALDIIQDFATGVDTIDLAALNPSNVSILYYNGGSIISGGSGASTFQIGSVRYVNASDLTGLVHGVYLVGDGDPNSLTGSALDDTIVGGAGNDTIIGGGAGDALYGGAGEDVFKYLSASDSNNAALDILHDFQTGVDKIDLTALNLTNVSILRSNGGSFVSGVTSGGAAFQIASTQDVNTSDLIGLSGAVYMAGDAGDNVLIGGPGNSTEIRGLGNDTLDGGAGNDTLIGGSGADSLIGGAGADTFKYLFASDSSQLYDGISDFQTGVDKLDVSALNLHDVTISRQLGDIVVQGVTADDQTFFVRSAKLLNTPDVVGLTAGVKLSGDIGTDTLVGGGFNDVIAGGAGTDTITGGGGADVMSGTGTGIVFVSPDVNTYVYLAASDSTVAAADRITDFQTGVDKIDLRAVHTGVGDTVNFLSDATATYLFVQHAGETSADMLILLNTPTFAMTDILW